MYISPHLHVGSSLSVGRRAEYEEPVSFVVWIVLSNNGAQLCQPWKWAPGGWWPLINLAPPPGRERCGESSTARSLLWYSVHAELVRAGWQLRPIPQHDPGWRARALKPAPQLGLPVWGGAPGLQVQHDSKLRPPGAQVWDRVRNLQVRRREALALLHVSLSD